MIYGGYNYRWPQKASENLVGRGGAFVGRFTYDFFGDDPRYITSWTTTFVVSLVFLDAPGPAPRGSMSKVTRSQGPGPRLWDPQMVGAGHKRRKHPEMVTAPQLLPEFGASRHLGLLFS